MGEHVFRGFCSIGRQGLCRRLHTRTSRMHTCVQHCAGTVATLAMDTVCWSAVAGTETENGVQGVGQIRLPSVLGMAHAAPSLGRWHLNAFPRPKDGDTPETGDHLRRKRKQLRKICFEKDMDQGDASFFSDVVEPLRRRRKVAGCRPAGTLKPTTQTSIPPSGSVIREVYTPVCILVI